MSCLHPKIISERGLININMLASKEVKNLHISDRKDDYVLRYANDEAENSNLNLIVRHQKIPKGQRRYWKTIYDFTVSVGGGNLDELIEKKYRSN